MKCALRKHEGEGLKPKLSQFTAFLRFGDPIDVKNRFICYIADRFLLPIDTFLLMADLHSK